MERFSLLVLGCFCVYGVTADSLSPPVNVTITAVKANSAVVTWDIPEGDPVIGFAITQQKKDVRMLRFIQEVNTTTRSCALWDLEEETDYIVHVQSISMSGTSPVSEPLRFRTPKEAETQASKSKDEVTMEEVGQTTQLRAGELIIIVVVLIMWAGVIALFCRQYDIIKDNEPNNNKDKAKNSSECSTPEHPTGACCAMPKNNNNNNSRITSVNVIEGVIARMDLCEPKLFSQASRPMFRSHLFYQDEGQRYGSSPGVRPIFQRVCSTVAKLQRGRHVGRSCHTPPQAAEHHWDVVAQEIPIVP
ncbi:fibronectin type III domain-containing protein 5-like [Takifugu rubripes]|uniref:fibronectin type III domain-containing protein 5-like n=1 Tax=Takifugu rubripes TaxID=31033 RepID=UPI00114529DB|nr:fibronectin type III domain-containing protein 5 [Takifugu rubripes]